MPKKKEVKKSVVVEKKVKEVDKKWFTDGKDSFEKKDQLDVAAKMRKEKFASRFLIKPDEEAVVVFVDERAFAINEHVRWTGKMTQYVTCCKDFDPPCPICDAGEHSMFTVYFTVIDTRKFTRKDNTEVKNRKVLIPIKGSAIKRLRELQKEKGSLTGLAVKIKRYTKDEPNCGSDFKALKKIDLVKNFGKDADKPLEYEKILAKPTDEEYASLGFGNTSVVGVKPHITEPTEDSNDLADLIL